MTKCENVARSVCIHILASSVFWALDFIETHKHKHKLSPLNFCTHQHLNLYLLKDVILKETGLVIGQYTHIYTTPLTHTQSP